MAAYLAVVIETGAVGFARLTSFVRTWRFLVSFVTAIINPNGTLA